MWSKYLQKTINLMDANKSYMVKMLNIIMGININGFAVL